jgi:hypothetical protein
MGILDNFEAWIDLDSPSDLDTYRVKCKVCLKEFVSASNEPFTCLLCSAKHE